MHWNTTRNAGMASLMAISAWSGFSADVNADAQDVLAHGRPVVANDGATDFTGHVVGLYVVLDHPDDRILAFASMIDVNLGTNYYQSSTGAGWLPSNDRSEQTEARTYADSFVTIGGTANSGATPVQLSFNQTELDPGFGGNGAAGPEYMGGWYVPGSELTQGTAQEQPGIGGQLAVMVGRFAIEGDEYFSMAETPVLVVWVDGENGSVNGTQIDVREYIIDDCNQNGIDDANDLFYGFDVDGNGDGILDGCLPTDLDGNGTVDGADLAMFLARWGTDDQSADFNNDGLIDGLDLALLLAAWSIDRDEPGGG